MGRNDSWGHKTSRAFAMCLGLGIIAISASGCRITDDDVHAWARKASGPRKLVAVLQHEKYETPLRVQAGLTLVSMAPRGGRAVGLVGDEEFIGLLKGLEQMSVEARRPIVDGMVPELEKGILFVPKGDEPDTSFAYKDAAYALLTDNETGVVDSEKSRERLKAALIVWCQNNFVARMDDTTQLYGMEQVLRLVRSSGVKGLTPLIEADFKKIRELAQLIHELADQETKIDASKRMVAVAKHVDSDAWIKQKAPAVEAANKASGLTVKEKQFEKQLEAYQEEELLRIFGAMKYVGQAPIVNYLIEYANDKENSEKRRAAALAGLENNLDRKNQTHALAMLDILSSDETPDSMRDVAVRRVGELSRDQVAEHLFKMFDHERWQVRWTVASLLLKMTDAKTIDEFMTQLGKVKTMALTEPLTYGGLLKDVKGEKTQTLVDQYAAPTKPVTVRLTALGYYYDNGTKDDLAKVAPFKEDGQKVPSCPKEAQQCNWTCTVTEEKKEPEAKEVATVGEFVTYCLVPAMEKREPEKKAAKTDPE